MSFTLYYCYLYHDLFSRLHCHQKSVGRQCSSVQTLVSTGNIRKKKAEAENAFHNLGKCLSARISACVNSAKILIIMSWGDVI